MKLYHVYRACYDKNHQYKVTDDLETDDYYEAFLHYAKILKKYHNERYIGNYFIIRKNGSEFVENRLYRSDLKSV